MGQAVLLRVIAWTLFMQLAAAGCPFTEADLGLVEWKHIKKPCAVTNTARGYCSDCVCALVTTITNGLTSNNVSVMGQPASDPALRPIIMDECLPDLAGIITDETAGNLTLDDLSRLTSTCDSPADIAMECPIDIHAAQTEATASLPPEVRQPWSPLPGNSNSSSTAPAPGPKAAAAGATRLSLWTTATAAAVVQGMVWLLVL